MEKCICHIKDAVTGESYVIKDSEARKKLEELATKKIDKYKGISILYGNDASGNVKCYNITEYPANAAVPQRDNRGNVQTNSPVRELDSANKKYVDKVYNHSIIFKMSSGTYYVIYFQSPKPDAYTFNEIHNLLPLLDEYGIPAYYVNNTTISLMLFRGYVQGGIYDYYFGVGEAYKIEKPVSVFDNVL